MTRLAHWTLAGFAFASLAIAISGPAQADCATRRFYYLNHDGNTGNIVVNEPADGDVTTCGAGYACKISAAKPVK